MGFIIGISGKMHSGKDTVASMLKYIHIVGPTAAKYDEWRRRYNDATQNKTTIKDKYIFHFADKLKDLVSITFSIDRDCFDSTEYKDYKYYDFRNHRFISDTAISPEAQRLTIADFNSIEDIRDKLINNRDIPLIKIRTLMQVYADAMKYTYGENFFINIVMKDVCDAANIYGLSIVPDVRFVNEANAIRNAWGCNGYIIQVNRENKSNTETHNSEIIDFTPNATINNDGGMLQLFYRVIDIYSNMYKYEQKLKTIKQCMLENLTPNSGKM